MVGRLGMGDMFAVIICRSDVWWWHSKFHLLMDWSNKISCQTQEFLEEDASLVDMWLVISDPPSLWLAQNLKSEPGSNVDMEYWISI